MDWYLMMLCIFHFQIQLMHNESHSLPAKGVAGVSCSVLHARGTALACKPVRALQGGIQCLYFASEHIFISRVYADSRSNLAL